MSPAPTKTGSLPDTSAVSPLIGPAGGDTVGSWASRHVVIVNTAASTPSLATIAVFERMNPQDGWYPPFRLQVSCLPATSHVCVHNRNSLWGHNLAAAVITARKGGRAVPAPCSRFLTSPPIDDRHWPGTRPVAPSEHLAQSCLRSHAASARPLRKPSRMTIPSLRRQEFLPFAPPLIGEEEIAEVVDTLRSGWITTGPKTKRFEQEFAVSVGAPAALALG